MDDGNGKVQSGTSLLRSFREGSRTESAWKRSMLPMSKSSDKAPITVKYLSGGNQSLTNGSGNGDNGNDDEVLEFGEKEEDIDMELNWNEADDNEADEDEADDNDLMNETKEGDNFFHEKSSINSINQQSSKNISSSVLDPESWAKEVDRVVPQLRLTIRSSDQKVDWRLHLQQLNHNREQLVESLNSTKDSISKLTNSVTKDMEKVQLREKYIQDQFEPLINEYISIKNRLEELNQKYASQSSGVTTKSATLSEITDELEGIKAEMEERGSTMTDGTPLVSLRKGLSQLKSEVTVLDIRIGVAAHTILRSQLEEEGMAMDSMAQHDNGSRRNSFQPPPGL